MASLHKTSCCGAFEVEHPIKDVPQPTSKGWFTLVTESEAQGALRSSVNQKKESEPEWEA